MQALTQKTEIRKGISQFDAYREAERKELVPSEGGPMEKRVHGRTGLITREAPRVQENVLSPNGKVRRHSSHTVRYPEHSQTEMIPVFDVNGPDDKPNKGANDKRNLDDGRVNDLKELQPLSFQHNPSAEHAQHVRSYLQKVIDEANEQSIFLRPQAYDEGFGEEHEASAMLGNGVGRDRLRRHHSTDVNVPDNRANNPSSSPTLAEAELEVPDSQDAYENEGVVESAKRVKPKTREKVKQHSTAAGAGNSAEEEPQYAHNYDHARDFENSHKSKDPPKQRKPWPALERYLSEEDSRPNFRPPPVSPSVVRAASTMMRMGGIPSGMRPRNTLRGNGDSSNPHYRLPRMNDPKSNGFALSDGDLSGRPQKRRKTEAEDTRAAQRHSKHSSVIELETQSSQKTPSARSTHSHTQVEQSLSKGSKNGNAVESFREVERTMLPPKRRRLEEENTRGVSSNQLPKHDSTHRPQAPDGQEKSIMQHGGEVAGVHTNEDPQDPISEDEIQYIGSEKRRKTIRETVTETIPEVVLRAYNHGENLSHTPNKTTGSRSKFFEQGEQRDSSEHVSGKRPTQPQFKRSTRHQNGISTKKNGASSNSNSRRESDYSIDELALDSGSRSKGRDLAQQLLSRRKSMDNSTAPAEAEAHYVEDGDSSEDNCKKADMKQTFLKQKKPNKVKGEDRFDVSQLFCEKYAWLSGDSDKHWFLRQNSADGHFTILDDEDNTVADFDRVADKFSKIERSREDGKLLLSKPRDNTVKGATQICLKLGDLDQSDRFCKNLKILLPRLGINLIEDEVRFKKKFVHILQNVKPSAAKRKLTQEPPHDDEPQVIPQKSRRRVDGLFNREQAIKEPGRQRMKDQMGQEEKFPPPARSLRAHNTRSSSEVFDLDLPEAQTKTRRIEPMPPKNFYSSPNDMGDLIEPRSSSRLSNREPAHKPPPRPRTPSPEPRWTELHPDWETTWRNSIIYPKEGKNKATVDKQDIQRLDEGEFLNDNLITFYMLHLELEFADREPVLSKRVYFLNTFFYQRLSNPEKGKKGINYAAVARWTAKVDLFSYDYIIVPVNEHTHWYVAIICNAPKLLNPDRNVIEDPQSPQNRHEKREHRSDSDPHVKPDPTSPPKLRTASPSGLSRPMTQVSLTGEPIDLDGEEMAIDGLDRKDSAQKSASKEVLPGVRSVPSALEEPIKPATTAKNRKRKPSTPRKYSTDEPRIITLDSLGIAHSPTCTNLRDYLTAEMKSKLGKEIPIPQALGMKAVKIPQQKNYCDCGLFLLSYIEEFLKHPDGFAEALLQKVDVEVDDGFDFTPAAVMRNRIRELIFDLQVKQIAEEDEKVAAKNKAKKAAKVQGKAPLPTTAYSREASKSARASVDPEARVSNRSSAQPEGTREEALQKSVGRSPQPGSVVQEPLQEQSAEQQRHDRHSIPAPPRKAQSPIKALESASQQLTDSTNEGQASPDSSSFFEKAARGILTSLQTFSTFGGDVQMSGEQASAESGSGKTSLKTRYDKKKGRTLSDALQIDDDSPQKGSGHNHQYLNGDLSIKLQVDREVGREDRSVTSPSPEVEAVLHNPRGRQSTPYPEQETMRLLPDLNNAQDPEQVCRPPKREYSETIDSPPLQSPPMPVFQITDSLDGLEGRQDAGKDDDEEMLLSQETSHAPALLGCSPPTPRTTPAKQQPALNPRRGSSSKPSPRKGSQSSGSRRPSESVVTRDASDLAIIATKYGGKHTTFAS